MDDEYYRQLVKRYLESTSTDEELEVFAYLLKEGKLDNYLNNVLNEEAGISSEDEENSKDNYKKESTLPNWLKYAAAAFLVCTFSLIYLHSKNTAPQLAITRKLKNDATPGTNKAILTLANGAKIILNEVANGKIAREGQTSITKINDGSLKYLPSENGSASDQDTYNTISTPRGGQYQVTLPEGSKVWLNSVSSITFPTCFAGNQRKVTITGEVYFEVTRNKTKPFFVSTKGQSVQVLGTHFNINAYEDEEKTRTTLLEGSIKITASSNNSKIMIPGQQAEVDHNRITILKSDNANAAVAWKNGYFVFDGADLQSLMRQISRWYDVNIIYNGVPGDHEFIGEIKRNTNLSNVLKILALSGVHFRIENNNLYIQP